MAIAAYRFGSYRNATAPEPSSSPDRRDGRPRRLPQPAGTPPPPRVTREVIHRRFDAAERTSVHRDESEKDVTRRGEIVPHSELDVLPTGRSVIQRIDADPVCPTVIGELRDQRIVGIQRGEII